MKKIVLFLLLAASLNVARAGGNLSDASGSLSGSSSQVALAANTSVPLRAWLFFQNEGTHTMWINFGIAAVSDQPSIQVAAGAIFRMDNFVSDDSINVLGTSGDHYTLKYK